MSYDAYGLPYLYPVHHASWRRNAPIPWREVPSMIGWISTPHVCSYDAYGLSFTFNDCGFYGVRTTPRLSNIQLYAIFTDKQQQQHKYKLSRESCQAALYSCTQIFYYCSESVVSAGTLFTANSTWARVRTPSCFVSFFSARIAVSNTWFYFSEPPSVWGCLAVLSPSDMPANDINVYQKEEVNVGSLLEMIWWGDEDSSHGWSIVFWPLDRGARIGILIDSTESGLSTDLLCKVYCNLFEWHVRFRC